MTTPERVSQREVKEILRTFRESGWASMTLELDGMRITVGKDGPPSAVDSSPQPAPITQPAPIAQTAPVAPAPTDPSPAAPTRPAPDSTVPKKPAKADTTGCVEVRSPAVGAFWVSPSPGEAPFVEVGQTVEADEQLAIVEVMKLMNPVVAPQAGEIVQVCAENAEMVEFDQPLFLIRPSDG